MTIKLDNYDIEKLKQARRLVSDIFDYHECDNLSGKLGTIVRKINKLIGEADDMKTIKRLYAQDAKELDRMTRELRANGYSLITNGKLVRELESDKDITVITIRK